MGAIGVLALQGGFAAHARALAALGHETREVRSAGDFAGLAGLVLPGGESTVQRALIERFGLGESLAAFAMEGKPVLATCAGLILCARTVRDPDAAGMGWLDVEVARNAWGRQIDSFEARADDGATDLVFIRAPRIRDVGLRAEVLLRYRGEPVMVRQGSVTGATFHPELSASLDVHRAIFGAPGASSLDTNGRRLVP